MSFGEFSGEPVARWITQSPKATDRNMQLTELFWFERDNRRWSAPANTVTDGGPLWSILGSPFTGDYRRAAIVHDAACKDTTVPRSEADRLFYYACRAGHCSWLQAVELYIGVRIGSILPDVRDWSALSSNQQVEPNAAARTAIASIKATFRMVRVDVVQAAQGHELPIL